MKLSARTCYGTRLLVELARRWQQGPTPLKNIARRQKTSLPYLARLMSPLIAAGLVQSMRGVHGGVWLVKPPHKIKLSEVVQLLEGPVSPMKCVANSDSCPHSNLCATRDVWSELEKVTNELLASRTLQG
ncbi:MAG TPA: Rrf2 family transcriptional regulator, partial [Candidatus Acetothermia bacterium]|nr:Rrf2 family transcriptional regulator [Candidatus Acetothermia bacterium]